MNNLQSTERLIELVKYKSGTSPYIASTLLSLAGEKIEVNLLVLLQKLYQMEELVDTMECISGMNGVELHYQTLNLIKEHKSELLKISKLNIL